MPDSAELFAEARKPRLAPEPEIAIVWPSAIVLSGSADATFGQVKLRPPAETGAPGVRPAADTGAPGVRPAAASPWAENVVPSPSKPMKPDDGSGSELSVTPVLL